MRVTLLDVVTGERKEALDWNRSVFWWTEGSGQCDCNRALAMDHEELENEESGVSVCLGHARFLVIDVHGDLEGQDKTDILREANASYPAALVKQHLGSSD